MSGKPILGLTMGDPAGIGPEICLRALREPSVLAQCVPVLFGDVRIIQRLLSLESFSSYAAKGPERTETTPAPCRTISFTDWQDGVAVTEPLIVDFATPGLKRIEPGEINAATAGKAGYCYIEEAIRATLAGWIEAVVTAPIHKEALRLSGVNFPGHTEIFTALTGCPTPTAATPRSSR